MLKPDNGAARRAKPLVKTCLAFHAREIGKKAWPRFEWRSSERLGKPIQVQDLSWTPLGCDRADEPEGLVVTGKAHFAHTSMPYSILKILLFSPRQSGKPATQAIRAIQHYSVCQTQK